DFNGKPDPRLTYKVPKGTTNLVAVVRDVNGNSGSRCIYRLQATVKATNAPAGFALTMIEDSHTLQSGRASVFKVEAKRDGYDGPIELAFDRLPVGVKVTGNLIPAKATATLLTLSSDQPLPPLITVLHGKAKDRDVPARFENAQLGKFQPWLENDLALAGAAKSETDFNIAWGKDAATNSIPLGGKLTLPVNCVRPPGHDGPVRLTLLTSQARIFLNNAVDPARVLREEKAVLIEEDKKAQQAFDATFKAELLKRDRRTVEAVAYTPVREFALLNPLVVKLTLPAPVKLDAKNGATVELTGQIERLAGAKGDVTVTLTGLPAGVTAPANATIKAGETAFKFALKFPANFKPGDVTGLKFSATGKPFDAAQVRSRDTELTFKLLPPDAQPEAKPPAKS
ncbi:MAG: hypothetical protein HY300_05000, partial [Verrucomicrobia bacterium]|nr:hypothetical protein [Verrucomicrobiota bacterium]